MKAYVFVLLISMIPLWNSAEAYPTSSNGNEIDSTKNFDGAPATQAARNTYLQLTGSWRYSLSYEEAETNLPSIAGTTSVQGAYLQIDFHDDGTYVRTIGTEAIQRTEHGRWMVSDKGDELMLLPEEDDKIGFITIDYLQLDELVLNLAIGNGSQQSVFMNKV